MRPPSTTTRPARTRRQLVSAINDTGYVSHLPAADSSAAAEDEAREQAQAREYSVLLTKSLVSVILGALAMIASMPLMGGSGHPRLRSGQRRTRRSVHRVGDARPRSADSAAAAVALRDRSGHAALPAARFDDLRDGLGGPALLRRRVEEPAPWLGQHEHADRDRHRRGLRLFRSPPPIAPELFAAAAPGPTCITKR